MDLRDIVLFGNENSALDFKAKQYLKSQYEMLLKDVMAMANADVHGDRFIIVGVKDKPSGDREILGIPSEEFVDEATYQQIIRENLEPEVMIMYKPFELDGKLLGVFQIGPCEDQPYMMRKKYGNHLNQGALT